LDDLELKGVESVFHLSALVHQMDGAPRDLYFKINVDNTIRLAEKCKEEGVSHFLFMSSVKVYGEENDEPYTETSECHPLDDYGRSKLEAERRLQELADGNFKVAIVRTPVVYGTGVKGNVKNLIELVRKAPALPFGGIHNRRSMVYVENLCNMAAKIIDDDKEGVFLASDDRPLSTTELIEVIADALGKRVYLFELPGLVPLLKRFKPQIYKRLYENLEVDNTWTKHALGITEQIDSKEGFEITIKGEKIR
jgi:UDP-glucose 4-epimerase